MEYDDAMREREGCEGTPSNMISTCARAILKLQDIVGPIPRIQSLGRCGEDVLQKVLNQTVDEYLAREEEELGGGDEMQKKKKGRKLGDDDADDVKPYV